MKRRNNHVVQGLAFVTACLLFAVVIFNAVKVEKVAAPNENSASETVVVNTYQPDLQLGPPQGDAVAPPSPNDTTAAGATGTAESSDDQDDPELVLRGDRVPCAGSWTDRQPNGITMEFATPAADSGTYRWFFAGKLAAQGSYPLTSAPARLQVDEYSYDMTCTDDEALVQPVEGSERKWDPWMMYRPD